MRNATFMIPISTILLGCAAGSGRPQGCARTSSVPIVDTEFQPTIQKGNVSPGWGGVLDLLEDPSQPDSSRRERCTVHMDFVPGNVGQALDPGRLAFWTADHCLKFARAQGAELYLFDPKAMRYIRFAISMDELESFKAGRTLFEDRKNTQPADTAAVSDFEQFIQSAARKSVVYNGAPLIERGAVACQSETETFKQDPNFTGYSAVCSTVLDLARVSVNATPESLQRPEVAEVLNRLAQALASDEESKMLFAAGKIAECGSTDLACKTLYEGFKYFLTEWRVRVSDFTRWRRFEAQSALIERIRTCEEQTEGLCAPEFQEYFKTALEEYRQWPGAEGRTFQQALKAHVDRTENLPWLLKSQADIQPFAHMSSQAKFGSNVLRGGRAVAAEQTALLPTLGESGATFYGLPSPLQLVVGTNEDPAALLLFRNKTILVPYNKTLKNSLTIAFQPGDSGSSLLIANTPIGVVATVDGRETSGGASVLPLPEYTEEKESNTTQVNQSPTKPPNKSTAQTGCR